MQNEWEREAKKNVSKITRNQFRGDLDMRFGGFGRFSSLILYPVCTHTHTNTTYIMATK